MVQQKEIIKIIRCLADKNGNAVTFSVLSPG
jgi:hypothetical protein